jgi:hypothetical protein
VVGEIVERNMDCSPAPARHAERRRKYHPAVSEDVNFETQPESGLSAAVDPQFFTGSIALFAAPLGVEAQIAG